MGVGTAELENETCPTDHKVHVVREDVDDKEDKAKKDDVKLTEFLSISMEKRQAKIPCCLSLAFVYKFVFKTCNLHVK